ncbi:MAG: hypothetical protein A3I68_02375 [Candidatus Melainabacteria bacterium RIFCSPLOWO2_02_FULL_35_15]|nr:MAG: hypothetical protein A3F80_00490 [Candidatus Melainabacteria bacterium RIFCSPLOWO2_12_FULL_35_11]OGI13253.1 MAG: hypothetical protein A3I68_02375 [Candidatus Melainabacteria bacterium RIFCSPLOWO2_02_FULL_35_15]
MILTVTTPVDCHSKDIWRFLYQPRQRVVKTIGIYKDQIFTGTGNGVLVSNDKGKTWNDFGTNQLLKDSSGLSSVNWIYIDGENKKIYITTNFGAYYSDIAKPDWHRFFENVKTESNEVNSLTVDKNEVYLSTNDGFWICNLNLGSCERLNQGLDPDNISGNFQILYALKISNELYLAASNGIYKLDHSRASWHNLSEGIYRLPDGKINARHLLLNKGNIWAACGTGIYKSTDGGELWKNVSDGIGKNSEGFQGAFYLFQSGDTLYSATENGIYFYSAENDSWNNLTSGIRTKENSKNVYWLAQVDSDLYAATDEGLFVLQEPKQEEQNSKLILKGKVETDFANLGELEPGVIEVQKQALKFASLPTNNDYKRYRLQARLRNIVPRLGVDLNTTGTSTNYYQIDKGISAKSSLSNDFNADKTNRYQYDGRAFKQLSVLWNTNQLFYDDEIKDILSQARLTANLKENLLDDVTRIYFQRRRLQLENLVSPPKDQISKLSADLQIAEFTGQLDSRTGGWFTKETERRKRLQVNNAKSQ